jgi:predicted exporter
MSDPTDKAEMLHEMSTVGVTMAVLITLVWLGMLAASSVIEKRALNPQPVKG